METLEVVNGDWLGIRISGEFKELQEEERAFLSKEIPGNSQYTRESSELPANRCKNRYTNYRPFDETRVKLESIEGMDGSDYINSSFLSGETKETYHYYIACQAPLDHTVGDFWRMIWEQRTAVVVMLTGLHEGNIVKADKYWPENGEVKQYGKMIVLLRRTFSVGEITIRSFLIREESSKATREVIQLHYDNWPDFGVPPTTKSIRDLILLMVGFRQKAFDLYSLKGPVVVHCSAGVGRTGVFVASHIALEKLLQKEKLDIKRIVTQLRTQRQGMVRTEEQYRLIYSIVMDSLKTNFLMELLNAKQVQRTSSCSVDERASKKTKRLSKEQEVLVSQVGAPTN